MSIEELKRRSYFALLKKNWIELEIVSQELLVLLRKEKTEIDSDLRKVARNYLASIIRDGKFLISNNQEGKTHFESGVKKFKNILESSTPEYISTLNPEIRYLQQIQIFLTNPRSDSSNKACASLRRLGRPDVAIDLSTKTLEGSRLNYYSLVVRGSAYIDLGMVDSAITDLNIALQHSPKDKREIPLTSLARAYREKFKLNGDLKDGETALNYAEESLKISVSPHIARIFISIVRALGREDLEYRVTELLAKIRFEFDFPDKLAIQISNSIINLANSEEIEVDEEPFEDFLEDFEGDWLEETEEEGDKLSEYFEDYFEEYSDSLKNPQMPHLEP